MDKISLAKRCVISLRFLYLKEAETVKERKRKGWDRNAKKVKSKKRNKEKEKEGIKEERG